jgi:hypothetical protein
MPTKQERRALRKQRRAERKKFRKERRIKFNEIIDVATKTKITIDLDKDEPKFAEAFNQVWPILKPGLEYAELVRLTGPGADRVLRSVINLGERISTGNASEDEEGAFISTLDTVWEPVKAVLGILVTFTDDKIDKIIDKIIEIGDWITES